MPFLEGFDKGQWCWVRPRDDKSKVPYVAGTVSKNTNVDATVQLLKGDFCNDCLEVDRSEGLRNPMVVNADSEFKAVTMAENSQPPGVENMIDLGDLHEGALLHNIRMRFKDSKIYTYVGSILLAVNPYVDLGYTTEEYINMYKGVPMGELPPHPFAVGDHVYTAMRRAVRDGEVGVSKDQAVVISGESGAGKTVTTSHILKYLTAVTGRESDIERQIISSGEMLETFGNAKTMRNHNSSRFGKFVEVRFDEDGFILGAAINHYLLEKSRLITQSEGERNYHVFYQLFCATTSEERASKWGLSKNWQDYHFINQSSVGPLSPDIMDDEKTYHDTVKAMATLDMAQDVQDFVFTLAAATLHIGNIEFKAKGADACEITNPEVVEKVSKLLGVEAQALHTSLLKQKVMQTSRYFDRKEAEATRNALAKSLYSGMFDWVCDITNETLGRGSANNAAAFIGVLDIFGFEHFTNKPRPLGAKPGDRHFTYVANNHFEQFCINFANEMLQNFFNENIFKQEMATYEAEGLEVGNIIFQNNDLCIDLVQDKKRGIMSILNECSREKPVQTWKHFLDRLLSTHKPSRSKNWVPDLTKDYSFRTTMSDYLDKVKLDKRFSRDRTNFIVQHYAGPVEYTAGAEEDDAVPDFVLKNKDKLPVDVVDVMKASSIEYCANIFMRRQGKTAQSVAGVFTSSLNELIAKLKATNALFVRTFKPNHMKKKGKFEDQMVLEQLRCAGMLETIKVRKMGYPRKRIPESFLEHYKLLIKMEEVKGMDTNEACMYILRKFVPITGDEEGGPPFQVGFTKLFMKDWAFNVLEKKRDERLLQLRLEKDRAALLFQCVYRARKMLDRLPRLLAEEKKVRRWNEEKLRRMRLTGMSADDVQAEMEEERRREREQQYSALLDTIVFTSRREVVQLKDALTGVSALLSDLYHDQNAPPLEDEARHAFGQRLQAVEESVLRMDRAQAALETEYFDESKDLDQYNAALVETASLARAALSDIISEEHRRLDAEKAEREHTIVAEQERQRKEAEAAALRAKQEEEERKKRMEREAEERRIREEEERELQRKRVAEQRSAARRVERDRQEKEQRERLEREEQEMREEMEAQQAAAQRELARKKQKRLEAAQRHQEWLEDRARQSALKREEETRREKMEKERQEFEERMAIEHRREQEQIDLEHKKKEDERLDAKRKIENANTVVFFDKRVKYGALYGAVKFVGSLPFFASGEWVGVEFESHVGSTPGNSGVCMGEQIFECTPGHGLFVRGPLLHIMKETEPPDELTLTVGDYVNVKGLLGKVRFFGPTRFGSGTWVGVELGTPDGKNNGTVNGVDYFYCEHNHGIFVRPHVADAVILWTEDEVQRRRQGYIRENNLDIYEMDDEFDEAELQHLQLEELEMQVKERFGAGANLEEFLNVRPLSRQLSNLSPMSSRDSHPLRMSMSDLHDPS